MNKNLEKVGNYRYRILALLLFATSINYFDRSIIGVMAQPFKNCSNGLIMIMRIL